MKPLRAAALWLAFALPLLGAEPPRIDAASPEALQRSYARVLASLDDSAQQEFALAVATIGLVYAQRPDLGGSRRAMETLNGKTAAEIIAASRKLTGYVRRGVKTVDASTAEKFSASVGNMLISLPANKQADFSEAVAKLLYRRESEKIADAEFLKSVNGKTADEIIEFAATIDVPFLANNRRQAKQYSIEKLSKDDAAKMGASGGAAAEKSGEPLDFKHSLVPRAQ